MSTSNDNQHDWTKIPNQNAETKNYAQTGLNFEFKQIIASQSIIARKKKKKGQEPIYRFEVNNDPIDFIGKSPPR